MIEAALGIVLTFLHLGAIVSVLLFERRHPSATLAWLLTLIFLPLLGLVLYLMFGTTRAKRVAARYREAAGKLETLLSRHSVHERLRASGSGEMSERARSLLDLGRRLATTPASLGNDCEMLIDGAASRRSIRAAAEEAKDHIHLQFFIIHPDETAEQMRDYLVERAKAGIEVRVLMDGVGTKPSPGFWRPLHEAGGRTGVFRPVWRFTSRLMRRDRIDFRNHRKVVVVDGKVGFTGGLNVGNVYFGDDENHWRDTFIRIQGPAALSLQAAFVEDWWTATDELLDDPRYFPDPTGNDDGPYCVQIIDSGPDRRFSPIEYVFTQAFALARERIWLTSPYFVPNESVTSALIVAALRGVDVRLLVPARPDHRTVYLATCSYFRPLLEAGARILLYEKGFIHAKTIVVDSWVGTIGSANLDMRSFHLNFELNAFVYGDRFTQAMAAQFEKDVEGSRPYTLEDEDRVGYPLRLLRAGARLFSPLI